MKIEADTMRRQRIIGDFLITRDIDFKLSSYRNKIYILCELPSKTHKELLDYLKIKEKYEEIFFEKIKEYNCKLGHETHYIKIEDDVMVINFVNSAWDYNVYKLEILEEGNIK